MEYQSLFSREKNKKAISMCHLLKILHSSMLSVQPAFQFVYYFLQTSVLHTVTMS